MMPTESVPVSPSAPALRLAYQIVQHLRNYVPQGVKISPRTHPSVLRDVRAIAAALDTFRADGIAAHLRATPVADTAATDSTNHNQE